MSVEPHLTEQEIADFLRKQPDFFTRHADLLVNLHLPAGRGEGTISLVERQQILQREKIRTIEARLAELLHIAQENDKLSEKVHQFSLSILQTEGLANLIDLITHSMLEDFQLPYAEVRLWGTAQDSAWQQLPAFTSVEIALRQLVENLDEPYCGKPQAFDVTEWFGENAIAKSVALIPLSIVPKQTIGMLALASDEDNHFYTGMGTLYLKRIGELASARIKGYLAV